jgi:hypothetical protein
MLHSNNTCLPMASRWLPVACIPRVPKHWTPYACPVKKVAMQIIPNELNQQPEFTYYCKDWMQALQSIVSSALTAPSAIYDKKFHVKLYKMQRLRLTTNILKNCLLSKKHTVTDCHSVEHLLKDFWIQVAHQQQALHYDLGQLHLATHSMR